MRLRLAPREFDANPGRGHAQHVARARGTRIDTWERARARSRSETAALSGACSHLFCCRPFRSRRIADMSVDRADLVVVGAGTVGGWASYFAKRDGVGRVVVLERALAGQGASSRAAGIVRGQGGTPPTVALGRWSIDFYRGQAATIGTDSGFRELGYLILAVTEEDERVGRERVEMQRGEGLDVRWLSAEEASRLIPTLSPVGHRGGSFIETDGCIDPPRNVRAYSLAMQAVGVELPKRLPSPGPWRRPGAWACGSSGRRRSIPRPTISPSSDRRSRRRAPRSPA